MTHTPQLETFTRLGFAARGFLYLLVAYMAVSLGRHAGSSDVLRTLAEDGSGRLLLVLIALGLLAYGAWRCLEAAQDLEGAGDGAKGALVRGGHAMSGGAHVLLGLLAAGLAFGWVGTGGGGNGADEAAGRALQLPAGALLVKFVAVGFGLGGLAEGWNAYRLKFLDQLDSRAANQPWVKWVGRVGYLARGVVFILIGLLLWGAASDENPARAGGMGEALASLSGASRAFVALGLGFFGVFSLVQAVYRRINRQAVRRPSWSSM